MQAAEFHRVVTKDESRLYDSLLDLLDRENISYCIVRGQGVNAYVAPLVSLNVDFVIAAGELQRALDILSQHFRIESFPNTINISAPGSELRAQIQIDPRYAPFVARAQRREVLGRTIPVAAIEDLLQGKYGQRPIHRDARANTSKTSPTSRVSSKSIRRYERECPKAFSLADYRVTVNSARQPSRTQIPLLS